MGAAAFAVFLSLYLMGVAVLLGSFVVLWDKENSFGYCQRGLAKSQSVTATRCVSAAESLRTFVSPLCRGSFACPSDCCLDLQSSSCFRSRQAPFAPYRTCLSPEFPRRS